MSRFAIIVDFALEDGSFDRFYSCVLENAEKSVSLEAGCHRFDVLIPDGKQGRIVLYEIYDDAEASRLIRGRLIFSSSPPIHRALCESGSCRVSSSTASAHDVPAK